VIVLALVGFIALRNIWYNPSEQQQEPQQVFYYYFIKLEEYTSEQTPLQKKSLGSQAPSRSEEYYQWLGSHSYSMTRDPDTVLRNDEAHYEREALNQEHYEGCQCNLHKKCPCGSDPGLDHLPMSTTCLFILIFFLLLLLVSMLIGMIIFSSRLEAVFFTVNGDVEDGN
jgi:hypothetical protein